MKNSIDNIIHRTQRYWYVDGLAELAVGLLLALLSGYFILQAQIKSLPLNPVLANLALLAALLLVVLIFRAGLQAVKARVTYPRTGYVAYPRRQTGPLWQRYGLTAWIVLTSLAMVVLATRLHSTPAWTPFLMGTVTGLTLLAVSVRFQLLRMALLAFALVLIGAFLSLINPGEPLASVLYAIAGGVCFLISGGITLVRYLRSTQPPAEEDR